MSRIRDLDRVLERWDWTSHGYEQAFPRGISIGDVDGHIELNYCHLFVETKHLRPDTIGIPPLKLGQHMSLARIVCQSPRNRAYILHGDAANNIPRHLQSWSSVDHTLIKRSYDWRTLPVADARQQLATMFARFAQWAETCPEPIWASEEVWH